MLFDRFAVPRNGGGGKSLLIIGGGGGVGSIAIQLACTLTQLTVIATASRPETRGWCETLGAHHVIDHSKPIPEQLKAIGLTMTLSIGGTVVIAYVVKALIGLRPSVESEEGGLDDSDHGEAGYHDDVDAGTGHGGLDSLAAAK